MYIATLTGSTISFLAEWVITFYLNKMIGISHLNKVFEDLPYLPGFISGLKSTMPP